MNIKEAINIAEEYLGRQFFANLNIKYIKVEDINELSTDKVDNDVTIKYGQLASLFRGLSLVKMNHKKARYSVSYHKHFDYNGLMHDCSRNGVLKVESAKHLILLSALFGLNRFLLYTEDVYEIEGEPYFGYLRGRFSKKELKEIVEYGDSFGVEVVPCIQTLSHLHQALRWGEYSNIRETGGTLYIGKEETYILIEKMIKTCREVFSSKNIHIGMDEAIDLGVPRYIYKNEVIDKTKEFLSHLNRVTEICNKYDFKPMMWEDMFFKLNSQKENWYEGNIKLSDEVKALIPDVGLVYWDYYHYDESIYDKKLIATLDTKKETIFAGGAISWIGFAPNITESLKISKAGLSSCLKNKVKNVLVTSWGDNGNECSIYASIPSLGLYSNMDYLGKCSDSALSHILETVTGDKLKTWSDLELPNKLREELLPYENPSKPLLYQDPLNGIFDNKVKEEYSSIYHEHYKKLLSNSRKSNKFSHIYKSLASLCYLLEIKSTIGVRLRESYQSHNLEKLNTCLTDLKISIKRLDRFKDDFSYQWNLENKAQGFDVIDGRLGYLRNRLMTSIKLVNDYLNKKIDSIPELEEKIIADKDNDAISDNGWALIASVNGV